MAYIPRNLADFFNRGLGFATGSASRSARLATPMTFDRFWTVPEVQFDRGPSGADGLAAGGAAGAAGPGETAAGGGDGETGFDALTEAVAAEFEGGMVTVTVGVIVSVVTIDGVPEAGVASEAAVGGTNASFVTVAGETGTVVIKVVSGTAVMSWLAGP